MSAVYVVDWFRIIIDITNRGYSHCDIGAAIGVSAQNDQLLEELRRHAAP